MNDIELRKWCLEFVAANIKNCKNGTYDIKIYADDIYYYLTDADEQMEPSGLSPGEDYNKSPKEHIQVHEDIMWPPAIDRSKHYYDIDESGKMTIKDIPKYKPKPDLAYFSQEELDRLPDSDGSSFIELLRRDLDKVKPALGFDPILLARIEDLEDRITALEVRTNTK